MSSSIREYLHRNKNYTKRIGPPTPEACFQDMVTVGKHVEESIEDEKRGQETRKERQKLSENSGSGAGKKNKLAKETTTGAGV